MPRARHAGRSHPGQHRAVRSLAVSWHLGPSSASRWSLRPHDPGVRLHARAQYVRLTAAGAFQRAIPIRSTCRCPGSCSRATDPQMAHFQPSAGPRTSRTEGFHPIPSCPLSLVDPTARRVGAPRCGPPAFFFDVCRFLRSVSEVGNDPRQREEGTGHEDQRRSAR